LPTRPELGLKRSSRRSVAAPYAKEPGKTEPGSNTGLTSSLKDKAALTAWEGDEDEPVIIQCMLERGANGGFGLGLNEHHRITHTAAGSSAEKAGLQVFDRIISLDGREVRGPIKDSIKDKDHGAALQLTIERPPKSVHKAIAAKESQPNSSPYSYSRRPPAVPRRHNAGEERGEECGEEQGGEQGEEQCELAEQDEQGKERLTLSLVLDAAADLGNLGLEISVLNYISAVLVGSSGERAGLKKGDHIVELDGKPCKGSVSEQLSSAAKAETVGVEVTVLRGQALSKKLSATLQVMAADL